jgi:hypothetical protein
MQPLQQPLAAPASSLISTCGFSAHGSVVVRIPEDPQHCEEEVRVPQCPTFTTSCVLWSEMYDVAPPMEAVCAILAVYQHIVSWHFSCDFFVVSCHRPSKQLLQLWQMLLPALQLMRCCTVPAGCDVPDAAAACCQRKVSMPKLAVFSR